MEAYPNSKSKENQFPLIEWGKISYTHVLDLEFWIDYEDRYGWNEMVFHWHLFFLFDLCIKKNQIHIRYKSLEEKKMEGVFIANYEVRFYIFGPIITLLPFSG